LVAAFIIVLFIWIYWNKQTEQLMPQQDTYWKDISGESEFRNKLQNNINIYNSHNYTPIPMRNDTQFINGMNKYLWDKQKQVGCVTCI
jgi:hypothetical protein